MLQGKMSGKISYNPPVFLQLAVLYSMLSIVYNHRFPKQHLPAFQLPAFPSYALQVALHYVLLLQLTNSGRSPFRHSHPTGQYRLQSHSSFFLSDKMQKLSEFLHFFSVQFLPLLLFHYLPGH